MIGLNESANVRQLASEILLKVESRKAYADILLDQTLSDATLNERDRALLTELTYGTLRWRASIDARLNRQLHRSLSATNAFVRNLLRVTVYQLLFLDKIPDYAAVNEAVDLAKNHGGGQTAGFVNGVLRNLLRQTHRPAFAEADDRSTAALVAAYSHPEWLVRRWLEQFGSAEACALMRANNERAPLILRANRLRCSRDNLLARLRQQGIAASAAPRSPEGILLEKGSSIENLPGFAEGWFQVQAESSQLVGYLLGPMERECILDACAAPGSKTLHIAELINDTGQVIALDKSARGTARIRENVARLNMGSVQIMRADASEELPAELSEPYDRILVDAPCSGLGTLRAHPEIKWLRQASDIRRLSKLQSKILDRVAGYLKANGVLVYSTCTVAHEENERVVEEFLLLHKEFELEDAARYLPDSAKLMVCGKYFQALPHRDNTDGFFAARLRKDS